MRRSIIAGSAAAFAVSCAAAGGATAQQAVRDRAHIVGSSTMAPFAELVIDRAGRATGLAAVSESTGTGEGVRRFCQGVSLDTPDVVTASRPMTEAERRACAQAGVDRITELRIGLDGIVIASAGDGQPPLPLTRSLLFDALAAEIEKDGRLVANPHARWREIDPALPDQPIEVLGPPSTSGTRDALIDLALVPGCAAKPAIQALSAEARGRACTSLRQDGVYVATGEDDRVTVQELEGKPHAVAVLGYGYVVEAGGAIAANPVDGVVPDEATIAGGRYPLARPLFLYVKDEHVGRIAALRAFLVEFASEAASGPEGYLADAGLVPLAEAERAQAREQVAALVASPPAR